MIDQNKDYVISVIVPAYNVQKYIRSTLECLARQTMKGIEIIVVDDCSEDNTLAIASELSQEFKNIVVLHNESNLGAGEAKNRGISASKGRYIGFCDADDTIPLDYFERLYTGIQKYNAEVACCNLCFVYENGKEEKKNRFENNCILRRWERLRYPLVGLRPSSIRLVPNQVVIGNWMSAAAPSMLFKREIIEKYPFYSGACDDVPAAVPAVAAAKGIVYIPDLYYNYFQRTDSLERSSFNIKRVSAIDAVMIALKRVLADEKCDAALCIVHNHLFPTLVGFIQQIPEKDRREAFQLCYERLSEYEELREYWDFIGKNRYVMATLGYYPEYLKNLYSQALDLLLRGEIESFVEYLREGRRSIVQEKPKVSIVIPVYNGANYMREAIDSALAQDYPNIEVIVVNDGSRDEGLTDQIARSYGNRIRYIAKDNGGVSTALNAGIKAMKGEYFSWLSHDDLYKPNKISRQISIAFNQDDPRTVIIGGYELFDGETGAFLDERLPTDLYTREQVNRPLFGVFHGLINGCSMLIHRSHFERVGLFNETLKTTQDYDMWFRLLRGERACYHDNADVRSRCHPQQESRAAYHGQDCFDLWKRLIDSTDPEERIAMSGSEPLFFRDVYRFLSEHTPYEEAAEYAHEKLFSCIERTGFSKQIVEERIERLVMQCGKRNILYKGFQFARRMKCHFRRRICTKRTL